VLGLKVESGKVQGSEIGFDGEDGEV